jgi:hypothetical protein
MRRPIACVGCARLLPTRRRGFVARAWRLRDWEVYARTPLARRPPRWTIWRATPLARPSVTERLLGIERAKMWFRVRADAIAIRTSREPVPGP